MFAERIVILKPFDGDAEHADPKHRAGATAERQLAFYLHRAFADDDRFAVLNNVRLVDPDQPDPGGTPGVCQIDHLVLHRYGAFIIESKSVFGEIEVRDDGSGGDVWVRRTKFGTQGIPSPIQQARRQGEFLRVMLQRNRERLLGRVLLPVRPLARILAGTTQRGFSHMPIQIVVAIADHGRIRRVHRWSEPDGPFRLFVTKADLVPDKVRTEHAAHKKQRFNVKETESVYGRWAMHAREVAGVGSFLVGCHTPGTPASGTHEPPAAEPQMARAEPGPERQDEPARGRWSPTCRHCGGSDLSAHAGRYGYYWKCASCGGNTTMTGICAACGAKPRTGSVVRVRKQGRDYFKTCSACGIEERVWTEPATE